MNTLVATGVDLNAQGKKARPVLKWAGGKTQLLTQLDEVAPFRFEKYIEPFFGGGAYFFHMAPSTAVIGDINPELINLYEVLSNNAIEVADRLQLLSTTEDDFYKVRAQNWHQLSPLDAAVRTVYLNRLCFNGLYRVNRQGHFNVPYGKYKNPKMPDHEQSLAAGNALARATIVKSDYIELLRNHAEPGDFVFLDPPYIPISQYSDFKRYTAEQFSDDDHRLLAAEFRRLAELGCHVVLTNSNHPLVHELYADFEIRIIETRRNISSKGAKRRGEDVIVTASATHSKAE